jgi:hypothetical protein
VLGHGRAPCRRTGTWSCSGGSLLGLKNCTIRCLLLRFRSSFPSPISLPWRCSRRNMVGCSQTREAGALHAGRYINRHRLGCWQGNVPGGQQFPGSGRHRRDARESGQAPLPPCDAASDAQRHPDLSRTVVAHHNVPDDPIAAPSTRLGEARRAQLQPSQPPSHPTLRRARKQRVPAALDAVQHARQDAAHSARPPADYLALGVILTRLPGQASRTTGAPVPRSPETRPSPTAA